MQSLKFVTKRKEKSVKSIKSDKSIKTTTSSEKKVEAVRMETPEKKEITETLIVEEAKTPEPVNEEKSAAEEKFEEQTDEIEHPAIDQARL